MQFIKWATFLQILQPWSEICIGRTPMLNLPLHPMEIPRHSGTSWNIFGFKIGSFDKCHLGFLLRSQNSNSTILDIQCNVPYTMADLEIFVLWGKTIKYNNTSINLNYQPEHYKKSIQKYIDLKYLWGAAAPPDLGVVLPLLEDVFFTIEL